MKNKLMRAATLLLVLTLMTSCFVGSTFAKYTTQVTGEDTARIAKFGVVLTADATLFEATYDGVSAVSVKADDSKDVIAPGTTDTATIFTIAGEPEVDVDVSITLNKESGMSIAKLPAATGTYKDYTDVTTDKKFDLADDYKPVKWTLKKNGAVVTGCEDVNLDVINTYLEDTLSGRYEVEGGVGAKTFDNLIGTYTLEWNWGFGVNDAADTYMGQIAAGVVTPAPSGYVANESFDFSLQVTQVD